MKYSPSTQRIWSLLLCAVLILSCPHTVLAEAPANTAIGLSSNAELVLGFSVMPASNLPPVRTASTGEELLELLKEDAGGVIRAAGDLVADDWDWWDWEDDEYKEVTRPVTVDMGSHTLFIETYTYFGGPIHFTGSGTVIQVNAILGTDENMSISATGEGAVAIRISDEAYWSPDYTLVEADGKHAIGVDIAYRDEYPLREVVVRARGAGSIGVRCAGRITLFLCQVTAEGESVVSGTGDIVIDCSSVQPLPAAVEVSRTAELASHRPLTYYTPVGVPLDFDNETVIYHLYAETERWPKTGEAPVDWNLDAVDYDTPGLYPISATVQPAFAALFPMVDWQPVAGTVKVLYVGEVYIPFIFSEPRGPYYAVGFHLYEPLEAEDILTVYYRPAGTSLWEAIGEEHISSFYYPENYGELWNEWFENREIDWDNVWGDDWDDVWDDDWDYDWEADNWESDTTTYIHNFFFDEDIDSTFEIQLSVVRGGETHWSNIASVTIEEEGGGDREGDGWEDGEEPGGTEPPGTPPPTGGGSRRSSTGSGGGAPDSVSTATGNTATTERTEALSDTPQPLDAAQPVISPRASTTPSTYPEGAAIYSATELSALALANPERIAFLEGRLQAVLPTPDLLAAVGGGSFAILLEDSGELGFHIRLFAGERELEALGGAAFQVSLPMPDSYESLVCTGEDGEELPIRVENARIVCDLTRTGRYTLAGEPVAVATAAGGIPAAEPDSPQAAGEPDGEAAPASRQTAWVIALSCAAVCAAGFVFLRRRIRLG